MTRADVDVGQYTAKGSVSDESTAKGSVSEKEGIQERNENPGQPNHPVQSEYQKKTRRVS